MASRPTRGREEEGGRRPLPKTVIGRVERSVNDAILAGRDGAPADPRWRAAEALARELGRGIDTAAAAGDPYALAQLGPKLLDLLRELRLTPPPQAAAGSLDALLADLAIPD